ncbi:MAG: hypothetical protein M3317_11520 [Actinomycetota bacterium]|nr:hypothetical protein [Actinomycetota bacterium]
MKIVLDAHISGEAFGVLISGVEETIADTDREEWVGRVAAKSLTGMVGGYFRIHDECHLPRSSRGPAPPAGRVERLPQHATINQPFHRSTIREFTQRKLNNPRVIQLQTDNVE